MDTDDFDFFCPACLKQVATKVIASGQAAYSSSARAPEDQVDAPYETTLYYVCACPTCAHPFLLRQHRQGVPCEYEVATDQELLYPPSRKPYLEHVPRTIRTSYEQAVRCFDTSLFEPCTLMCRKSLEVTCKSLEASGRTLYAMLEDLGSKGQIESRLLDWAHEIRLIGNDAAHDSDVKVTKRDARDILEFTEAILIYVFSLTTRFQTFRNRRAKAKSRP